MLKMEANFQIPVKELVNLHKVVSLLVKVKLVILATQEQRIRDVKRGSDVLKYQVT